MYKNSSSHIYFFSFIIINKSMGKYNITQLSIARCLLLFALVTTVFFPTSLCAQTKLLFNSDGKMIVSPPEIVLTKDLSKSFSLEVLSNGDRLKEEWEVPINRMIKAYAMLGDEKNVEVLTNYFGISKSELNIVRSELYWFIQQLPAEVKNEISISYPPIPGRVTEFKYLPTPKASLDSTYFGSLLLIDNNHQSQYRNLGFSYNNSSKSFLSKAIGKTGEFNEVRYDLRLAKVDNMLLFNWMEQLNTAKLLDIEQVRNDIKSIEQLEKINDLDSLMKDVQRIQRVYADISPRIDSLLFNKTRYDSTLACSLVDNTLIVEWNKKKIEKRFEEKIVAHRAKLPTLTNYKEWVLKWLWYSGGVPILNPYTGASKPKENTNKKLTAVSDKDISFNNEKARMIEKIIDDTVVKLNSVNDAVALADAAASSKSTAVDLEVNKLQYEKDKQKNLEAAQKAEMEEKIRAEALKAKDDFLYNGRFFITQSPNEPVWMRHHNIENKGVIMNKGVKKTYTQDDKVYILAENVVDSIDIEFGSKPFVPTAEFTLEVTPAIPNIAFSFPFDSLKKLQDQVEQKKGPGDSIEDSLQRASCLMNLSFYRKLPEQLDVIRDYSTYFTFLKSFLSIPSAVMVRTSDTTPARFTQLIVPIHDTIQKSSTVIYPSNTEDKSKIAGKYSYNFEKTHRFLPAAGLIYGFRKNPEVEVHKDGRLSATYHHGFVLTAGVKTYPFRTSVTDPYPIYSVKRTPQQKFDITKLSLYTGLNVLSPLKDFQLGVNADLVSGLSFTTGVRLLRLEQQKFVGNEVEERGYLGTSYYLGLMIDPILFVKLVNAIGGN